MLICVGQSWYFISSFNLGLNIFGLNGWGLVLPVTSPTRQSSPSGKEYHDFLDLCEPALPRIDEILRLVIGAKYLSKIDIRLTFHRVAVALKSRLSRHNVMPFGLPPGNV